MVDAFIERETKDVGELDAPLFYEALRETIASGAAADTADIIEVEGEIVDNQLVLDLPEELEAAEQMRNMAILIGNQRVIIKWKNDAIYPTAH